MGARDFSAPRGLSKEAAAAYLGVKRRTFERIASELRPTKLGTSLVYDVRDLDALFDRMKVATREPADLGEQPSCGLSLVSTTSSRAVSSSPDRRPAEKKGVEEWVVKQASTRTPRAGGGSTESTGVSAFKAVSTRIRKLNPG
jgi:hypothetical protein